MKPSDHARGILDGRILERKAVIAWVDRGYRCGCGASMNRALMEYLERGLPRLERRMKP